MKPFVIINDVHLGVKRVTGTTKASSAALVDWGINKFQQLLQTAVIESNTVIILGDLFDSYRVSNFVMKQVLIIFYSFLANHPERTVHLVRGNHDYAENSDETSSLELLAGILELEFGTERCVYWTDAGYDSIGGVEVAIVPHVVNQEAFDNIVTDIVKDSPKLDVALFHCNYDNFFAVDKDHSLNLSAEQAQQLMAKNITIGIAHEHPARQPAPQLTVFGNQIPTSIADCLRKEAFWYYSWNNGSFENHPWLGTHEVYDEIPWEELDQTDLDPEDVGDYKFIRIVGDCQPEDSGSIIREIAKFRAKSPAFIISNATKVILPILAEDESLPQSFDEAAAFDVMQFLKDLLSEKECKKIEEVLS